MFLLLLFPNLFIFFFLQDKRTAERAECFQTVINMYNCCLNTGWKHLSGLAVVFQTSDRPFKYIHWMITLHKSKSRARNYRLQDGSQLRQFLQYQTSTLKDRLASFYYPPHFECDVTVKSGRLAALPALLRSISDWPLTSSCRLLPLSCSSWICLMLTVLLTTLFPFFPPRRL